MGELLYFKGNISCFENSDICVVKQEIAVIVVNLVILYVYRLELLFIFTQR